MSIPAESCRAWVAEHFSCERMAAQYLDVYDRAAGGDHELIVDRRESFVDNRQSIVVGR